jgi:signal transduction histidine kinase/CheY-like chemotaxis protein
MNPERASAERRVLLLAPTARDAEASCAVFDAANIECEPCKGLDQLCAEIAAGAAALLVPEEVVLADVAERLRGALRRQPVWSDLPVIVLSSMGAESPAVAKALSTLGNVSLIERPTRVSTLLSLVTTALRARERQYQVRDLLAGEQEARAEADAANQAKDHFLAVLSHELRTPLSPVLLSVAAMETDPALSPELREEVSMIRRNVDLEARLIDDLLDLSRVINGKLRLQMQPTGVHDLLRQVVRICASDLAAKRLALTTELEAGDDRVTADPARLQQVFWNLLKNAIQFTPEGGRIDVRSRRNGDGRLAVEVRDSGIGIPAEVLHRMFDAFEQGDAKTGRPSSGLGLGLAISKAVVELHGGTIRAASDGAGQGASLVVEIPLAPQAPTMFDPASEPEKASPRMKKPRLLLVEDHADTAHMLARLLRLSGYRVKIAGSVAQALAAAAAERFDLLISDLGLPDASGHDLMRQVRALYGTPGIALSGYGMEEDIRKSHEAGFLEHVTKPVNLDQLKTILHRVVGAA